MVGWVWLQAHHSSRQQSDAEAWRRVKQTAVRFGLRWGSKPIARRIWCRQQEGADNRADAPVWHHSRWRQDGHLIRVPGADKTDVVVRVSPRGE